jgi:hypothetical protein
MRWLSHPMRYIHTVRELLRKHSQFFLAAALAGFGLRLFLIFRFPGVTTDSFTYGDIAKNWLQHGIYGLSGPDEISATYIRLPGYPAFLAAVFAIFGVEHYRAVLFVQMCVDMGACLLIADMTRRLASPRAAKAAFLLAALCPFLAGYAAAALTETLEVFFTALALDLSIVALNGLGVGVLRAWFGCGLAIGAAILLRPDGGLLLIAIGGYLLALAVRPRVRPPSAEPAQEKSPVPAKHLLFAGLIVTLVSLAPLLPWTWRNQQTFHRFQPLAPRYANEEDEFVPMGFNRWVKTWIADYSSVEEIYWPVPGSPVAAEKLPSRAFDSESQRQQTVRLLKDYNQLLHISPDLDTRFEALASQRIHNSPLHYYVGLPLLRIADMWLRPRTEMMPCDSRWWEFNDDLQWSILAVSLGVINLLSVAAAFLGLMRGRFLPHLGLLVTFLILRSVFLGTLENPEPRYTLECYPVVILLASALFRS